MLVYCQTANPSKNLQLLVDIIINIYGPAIFSIKENWHVSQGSKHYFNLISLSRDLLKESHPKCFSVVIKVLKTNGFYSHPENILLAMISDEDPNVRNKAIGECLPQEGPYEIPVPKCSYQCDAIQGRGSLQIRIKLA